ncbi:MAG: Flp pilus assembly complex ATPase component TadA, partial [Sedimentisphaerales bacterium]|nr:Flp pilus assembly complex ATPase component TadA [Sedimentisphaerales bacterium]
MQETNGDMTGRGQTKHKANAHDIVGLVNDLLKQAVAAGASDIHFEPGATELNVKFRLDGVLSSVERLPATVSDNVIARLKVLGGLLTYRNDIPQEGRLEIPGAGPDRVMDVRMAVFPTI